MATTTVLYVPLRQFGPPALLILNFFEDRQDLCPGAEAFLVPPDGDGALVYRGAFLQHQGDATVLAHMPLIQMEPEIRRLIAAVPLEQRAAKAEIAQAAPAEVAARRSCGQYPALDSVQQHSRDSTILERLQDLRPIRRFELLDD